MILFNKDRINTFLTHIDFASQDSKEVPYFFQGNQTTGLIKQDDLSYGNGLLVAEGGSTQANGFYFLQDILIKQYRTVLLKPLNIEHKPNLIVGNIYDVALVKRPESRVDKYDVKDYLIHPNEIEIDSSGATRIKDYAGQVDMWIGFLLYSQLFPEIIDYVKDNKDKLRTDQSSKFQLGLSMEIWYEKYGYLFDCDEATIEEKNESNAFLDNYIGKEYANKQVYKVYLDKFVFAAAALTETAAEKRSFLLDVASKFLEKGKGSPMEIEELILKNYAEHISALGIIEKEVTEENFGLDISSLMLDMSDLKKEGLQILTEVAAAEQEEYLVKLLSEPDIAAKTKEKKKEHKSKPEKYKDVPLSQFADPVNYKYPLNTAVRVRAAIVYFTRYGSRYSSAEQKAIWRKILRAAKKFGITVSEKVSKREKSSQKIQQEVDNMDEILQAIKGYFKEFQSKFEDFATKNNIDAASIKNLLAEEKMGLLLKDVQGKDDLVKDLSTAKDEAEKKISEMEEAAESLKKEIAEKDTSLTEKDARITEIDNSNKELTEKIGQQDKDLAEYKKEELVKGRLHALKGDGVEISKERVESVVDKASTYTDEQWSEYVEGLKDVATKKDDSSSKKEEASTTEKPSLLDMGKAILSDKEASSSTKDSASSPGTPVIDPKEVSEKAVSGFAKNFPAGRKSRI